MSYAGPEINILIVTNNNFIVFYWDYNDRFKGIILLLTFYLSIKLGMISPCLSLQWYYENRVKMYGVCKKGLKSCQEKDIIGILHRGGLWC